LLEGQLLFCLREEGWFHAGSMLYGVSEKNVELKNLDFFISLFDTFIC